MRGCWKRPQPCFHGGMAWLAVLLAWQQRVGQLCLLGPSNPLTFRLLCTGGHPGAPAVGPGPGVLPLPLDPRATQRKGAGRAAGQLALMAWAGMYGSDPTDAATESACLPIASWPTAPTPAPPCPCCRS